LTIASYQNKINTGNDTINQLTLQLTACQNAASGNNLAYSAPIVGDCSCGGAPASTASSGSGTVSYVGPNYVVINGAKIYLGSCSNTSYKSGQSQFNVKDQVNYSVVQSPAKIWGTNVACQ
jgi:hypothetical protein